MKNPLIPAGIEPATFRFVAQHLNHCTTAVPTLLGSSWHIPHKKPILPTISKTDTLFLFVDGFVNFFRTFWAHCVVKTRMLTIFNCVSLPPDLRKPLKVSLKFSLSHCHQKLFWALHTFLMQFLQVSNKIYCKCITPSKQLLGNCRSHFARTTIKHPVRNNAEGYSCKTE